MQSIRLNKLQIILVALFLIVAFLILLHSSFSNPFPKHYDEWIHINRAMDLEQGEYQWHSSFAFEFGFHAFLYVINQIVDLIYIYKFLAPIWVILTALVIFFIAHNLSGRNFLVAFLTMIFFVSIKSNANLLGLYFFIPLTFAIPFIFLFIFFFVRGLEKENKKYLFLSFLTMLLLVPIHAISVTFAFPVLLFSGILYYKYIKKEFRFFLVFLLIPLAGLIFFSFVKNLTIIDTLEILTKELRFIKEWGGAKFFNDSITTTYSLAGGVSALMGFLVILWSKKRYLYPYIVWPLYLFLMILIVRITDLSYLAPYHRNFYYFTISLPLLSAFGLNWIINILTSYCKKNYKVIVVLILVIVIFFSLKACFEVPAYTGIITIDDYRDLIFLAEFPKGNVLTLFPLSVAITPVTGHKVIRVSFDPLTRRHVLDFLYNDGDGDCHFMDAMLKVYRIDYIVSPHELPCGYKLLRSEHNYIYQVSD